MDAKEAKIIRGEPLYYGTGQVAEMLEEADSTVRFWSDEFEEFLKIERTGPSNKRRQFTQGDIKKLEYIKHLLKDENLSIKQVKEFLTTENANNLTPINKEKEQIMVDALANVVSNQIEEKFNNKFKELEEMLLHVTDIYAKAQKDHHENVSNTLIQNNEELRAELKEELKMDKTSIEEMINDTLKKNKEEQLELLEEIQSKAIEREEKLTEYINDKRESDTPEEKKGFFKRLFGK